MTKEEAIKILKSKMDGSVDTSYEWAEAVRMAIESIANEPTPCEKCIHVKSCRKVIILKNRTYKLIKYCSHGAKRSQP